MIFHLTMTAIYLSPPNLLKIEYIDLAQKYMGPFFKQNWHLFSPDPGFSSSKLWLRCQDNNKKWSHWADPFSKVLTSHHQNRFNGSGNLFRVYNQLIKQVYDKYHQERTACMKINHKNDKSKFRKCSHENTIKKILTSNQYKLAAKFSYSFCKQQMGNIFSQFQFKILNFWPKKFSERNNKSKKWNRVEEINFDASNIYHEQV